ncbi:BMP family ABC transporter substrate-binding protein [soil metagenome]
MKQLYSLLFLLAAICSAGCGKQETPQPAGSAGDTSSAPAGKSVRVGMVFDIGGIGDKSFNDGANRGLKRAQADLGAVVEVYEPHDNTDRETGIRLMTNKKMDVIIGVGFLFTDSINNLAKEYPNQKFACIDYTVTPGGVVPPNVLALKYKEEDGSYLVGALSAWLSKSKKIGFVGGMEIPLIQKFEAGFINGAKKADPSVEVMVKYAGNTPEAFANPGKGKELALQMFDQGADIIFHASGSTGLGVFEASRERKKLAIGVDSDQYDEAPGFILTSMVKNVDSSVYDTIKAAEDGTFKGGVLTSGLVHGEGAMENGVDYIYNDKNKALIPDDIHAKVEALRQEIIAGKINTLEGAKGQ